MTSTRKPICRGCNGERNARLYLCYDCWYKLSPLTREALLIKDQLSIRRAADMFDQIRKQIPLSEVRISERWMTK